MTDKEKQEAIENLKERIDNLERTAKFILSLEMPYTMERANALVVIGYEQGWLQTELLRLCI